MTATLDDPGGKRPSRYDPDVEDEVEPGGPYDDRDLHEGELPNVEEVEDDPDLYAPDATWPRDAA